MKPHGMGAWRVERGIASLKAAIAAAHFSFLLSIAAQEFAALRA
jgi:hypothetical protein